MTDDTVEIFLQHGNRSDQTAQKSLYRNFFILRYKIVRMSSIQQRPGAVQRTDAKLRPPVSDGSNLSFKSKMIGGKRYWYPYISIGTTRREHYLGEESTELLDRIEDEKSAWESNADDRELRRRLVSMLVAGGMTPPGRGEGRSSLCLSVTAYFLPAPCWSAQSRFAPIRTCSVCRGPAIAEPKTLMSRLTTATRSRCLVPDQRSIWAS